MMYAINILKFVAMTQRLLFVEASLVLHRIIDITLGRGHFTILAAKTGKEALLLSQQQPLPDIALIGIQLPDMSGLALSAALHDHCATQTIPVLLLANVLEPLSDEQVRTAHAAGVVYKPFAVQALTDVIHKTLSAVQAASPPPLPLQSPQQPPFTLVPATAAAAPVNDSQQHLAPTTAELRRLAKPILQEMAWEIIPDLIDRILREHRPQQ